ncbi:hypothetical protein KAR91_81340 [Candidatus Pacearchaeota archaeon]|nr:hypothetical protein [Candidatus Pacearchaeota archaeon]
MKDKIGLTVYAMVITLVALGLFMDGVFIRDEATTEVESAKEDYTFDDLLDAIEWVESGGDPNAVGDIKFVKYTFEGFRIYEYQAIGAYQIHEIYIDDFNHIQELNGETHRATYKDRWNKEKSRRITATVICHYANHDWKDKEHTRMDFFETAARTHKNPTERNMESTKPYWEKVKAYMERPVE